jgi:hypothetical protein
MSNVAGAVYLQDTFISLQALSTPFFATDQKGSLACPCETTIISTAKAATDVIAHVKRAAIVKYTFFIISLLLLINLCAFKQIIEVISKTNILDTTYSIFKSYYRY